MTQRQKYEVIEKFTNFERRSYEPCVIAQIEMLTNYNSASSGAFRYLFNYISKGNQTSTAIAMTAPVIAATEGALDSDRWTVSFVMPAGSMMADLPAPKDSKVVLNHLERQECVALSFRGRATLDLCTRKEQELRLIASKEHFELSNETRICRFDPPFKPGILHYNEIVIPIATG